MGGLLSRAYLNWWLVGCLLAVQAAQLAVALFVLYVTRGAVGWGFASAALVALCVLAIGVRDAAASRPHILATEASYKLAVERYEVALAASAALIASKDERIDWLEGRLDGMN